MVDGRDGLLEAGRRLSKGQPRRRLPPSLAQVAERRLPPLGGHGMMGETVNVLDQPPRVEALDGLDDSSVQLLAPLAQEALVGDVVSEGVLEGVFQLRK